MVKWRDRMYMREIMEKTLSRIHRFFLYSDNFTIISNNCWGGIIYKYFGMKFQSPTVGMYFFADEYIRFLTDLKYYLSQSLIIKDIESSKYKDEIRKRGQNPLIGWLDDIEIVLLHYDDPNEAKEKWQYRLERINYNRLIIKFNDQNLFNIKHLIDFEKLPYKNKICFTGRPYKEYSTVIWFKEYKKNGYVVNDTKIRHWRKYFNVIKYINNMKIG